MNNNDIRGVILSYFRSIYYKKCIYCNKICQREKNNVEIKYIHWNKFTSCHCCFKKTFLNSKNQEI